MSAIGDYIHLSAKGYQESGTRRPHWTPTTLPAAALNKMRNTIEARISDFGIVPKRTLVKLENQMNKLITATGEDRPLSVAPNPSATRQQIKNIIDKDMAQLHDIQMDRLAIEKTLPPMTKIPNKYADYKKWRNQIISRVNTLNMAINQAKGMINDKNGTDAKSLDILLTKLETLINDTYQKTYAKLLDTGVYVYKKNTVVKNLIKKLNELIVEYNEMPIIDNHENLLLKSIIEVLPDAADIAVRKRLDEVLNTDDPSFKIERGQILTEAAHKQKMLTLGDIEQIITTKDRGLEISFKWKDKQEYNAKLNNLNLAKGRYSFANIGTDMSLGELLEQKPSTTDFANHFYNIYTQHQDASGGFLNELRKDYSLALKMLAIYKAFNNETFGKDKIFIYTINGKEAHVVSTRDLLKNMVTASEQLKSVTQDGVSVTRMKLLENKKVPNNITGAIRISRVLAEAHGRKIAVAINSSLMEDTHKKR